MMSNSGSRPARPNGEEGWALLGLILALAILGIALSSSIVPNVQFQVQRDKEAEMLYRGQVMAQAIARYYNPGNRLGAIQVLNPPSYGHLTDLKKLRDGVTVGVNEVKFVRGSAIIDPMTGVEWEPVRLRDPRIMKVLQAYAAVTQTPIPMDLLLIAGPPPRSSAFGQSSSNFPNPGSTNQPGTSAGTRPPNDNGENENDPEDEDEDDEDEDDDEDDEDDDEIDEGGGSGAVNDPLAHLFEGGATNLPIVGVAPKLKGQAIRSLYGLTEYEEWVFIYIPPFVNRTNNRLR